MKILIVNDDGIDSPGLHKLAKAATQFGQVMVVAPDHQCSAMSHRTTIREDILVKPVNLEIEGVAAYSISGTPADCTKVAFTHLKYQPDYVFSGINDGTNTGFDIAYSGTIGGAMEGLFHGVPAIAFSRLRTDGWTWDVTDAYLINIIQDLLSKPPVLDAVWNVNFPCGSPDTCKGILWDRTIAKVQYFEDHYDVQINGPEVNLTLHGRPLSVSEVPEGTDLRAVLEGYVSIGLVKSHVL